MAASRRVLVIEDDSDIRQAIADILLVEGHSVSEAADGLDGLRRARECPPDVILLDLMMPRMDGWAFREAQQADPALANVPVVVVSACADSQVHRLGAVAHLHKPFDVDDLLAVISRA